MKLIRSLLMFASGALLAQAANAQEDSLAKGEYLTRAANCVACHTVSGGKPFAGGVEFKLPFGSLFSPNITPDTQTGIGAWTNEEFVSALQTGVGRDGKHYYPAFPYTSYSKMSRDDILAIKTYLDSLAMEANGNIAQATLIESAGITSVDPATGRQEFFAFPDLLTTNICFGGADMMDVWVCLSTTGKMARAR